MGKKKEKKNNLVVVEDMRRFYLCKFEEIEKDTIGLSDIHGPYTNGDLNHNEYRRFSSLGPLQLDFAKDTDIIYLMRVVNDVYLRSLDTEERAHIAKKHFGVVKTF